LSKDGNKIIRKRYRDLLLFLVGRGEDRTPSAASTGGKRYCGGPAQFTKLLEMEVGEVEGEVEDAGMEGTLGVAVVTVSSTDGQPGEDEARLNLLNGGGGRVEGDREAVHTLLGLHILLTADERR
jgi:hypothetical protein